MNNKQNTINSSIQPYDHLIPIVELLLKNGNKLADESNKHRSTHGFYKDKDGWICDLNYSIDTQLVKSSLKLDDSIIVNTNGIFCEKTWTSIRGNIK